ncbi:pro-sigmaK processing inhibitor BofA family protein [Brevibacterium casei]|nr:pro-sigmaK processing inhibitor BofA family protein [Brevibacterium casei]
MRYLIALIVGIVALFVVNAFTGIFSLPRPWNSLSMGGIVGITMVIILLIWGDRASQPARRHPGSTEDERRGTRAGPCGSTCPPRRRGGGQGRQLVRVRGGLVLERGFRYLCRRGFGRRGDLFRCRGFGRTARRGRGVERGERDLR